MTSYKNPRAQANYRAYHQMAVAGVPPEAVYMAFEESDREVINEMVMKDYWKMVRSLLRTAPVFQRKLDFLSSFLEKPVEEVLDAIATAHFPEVTVACTQPNHNKLRQWINALYKHANDQLDGAQPTENEWWREMNEFMEARRDIEVDEERRRGQLAEDEHYCPPPVRPAYRK